MPDQNFRKIIEELARKRSATVTVFSDFCRMSACALAMGTREEEYLSVAKNYSRDELSDLSIAFASLVQEMERNPFADLLGPHYLDCAAHSSKQARGEFFTPPAIAQMIARMTVDVDEVKAEGKPITVNEPACGSGGMVLALAELFAPDGVDLLRVTAQDINPVAADMCYINLTLWGVPARVILGDTIRMTVTREWKNLHWFRVGEEQRQTVLKIEELLTSPHPAEPVIEVSDLREPPKEERGQFMFNF